METEATPLRARLLSAPLVEPSTGPLELVSIREDALRRLQIVAPVSAVVLLLTIVALPLDGLSPLATVLGAAASVVNYRLLTRSTKTRAVYKPFPAGAVVARPSRSWARPLANGLIGWVCALAVHGAVWWLLLPVCAWFGLLLGHAFQWAPSVARAERRRGGSIYRPALMPAVGEVPVYVQPRG